MVNTIHQKKMATVESTRPVMALPLPPLNMPMMPKIMPRIAQIHMITINTAPITGMIPRIADTRAMIPSTILAVARPEDFCSIRLVLKINNLFIV